MLPSIRNIFTSRRYFSFSEKAAFFSKIPIASTAAVGHYVWHSPGATSRFNRMSTVWITVLQVSEYVVLSNTPCCVHAAACCSHDAFRQRLNGSAILRCFEPWAEATWRYPSLFNVGRPTRLAKQKCVAKPMPNHLLSEC